MRQSDTLRSGFSKELRKAWLDFYKERGHEDIGAVSLIGDGTTKESDIKYICICDNGVGYVLKKDSKYTIEGITENCDYYFYFVSETELEKINQKLYPFILVAIHII